VQAWHYVCSKGTLYFDRAAQPSAAGSAVANGHYGHYLTVNDDHDHGGNHEHPHYETALPPAPDATP